jgi:hypothetical protein
MLTVKGELEWHSHQTKEYRSQQDDMGGLVEDLEDDGKLGKGFTSVDELEEMDLGDGGTRRPTYINASLSEEQKKHVWVLFSEFVGCFAWDYSEMSVLSRDLVEH